MAKTLTFIFMTEFLSLIPYFLLLPAILVGFYWGKASSTNQLGKEVSALQTENNLHKTSLKQSEEKTAVLEHDKRQIEEKLYELQGQVAALKEKNTISLEERQKQEQALQEKFENLANRVFEHSSKTFVARQKSEMDTLLLPFKKDMDTFKSQVEKYNENFLTSNAALDQKLKHITELNNRMLEDAKNLTEALKGDKQKQGAWGEMVLERILEMSGLEKGREYVTQDSYTNEDRSRMRPDVVVKLPDGKRIIIDSKVSLTAYERFYTVDDDSEKEVHLKSHIQSLKNHIKSLGDKGYQKHESLDTLDFVFMFIPIEGAYSVAIREDDGLLDLALSKNVILMTPLTLLSALRTANNLWRIEDQNANAKEIARLAGRIYEKLALSLEDLVTIGKNLDKSKQDYENVMGRLTTGKGNLVRTAEELKKLGADTTKTIDPKIIEKANDSSLDSPNTLSLEDPND
ncbi:MAG: DNA recombination protein RmuC [Bacteroidota bacterium]|nr:DNA recombination protein RmuC [Bacteroidota bacterium]